MTARPRIQKELRQLQDFDKTGVSADIVNDNILSLRGKIKGPEGTPYEGGVFDIEINVLEDYPFSPPKMKFITKVWHPNISSATGAICLDILKTGTDSQWSPAQTIRSALLSLQALLSTPEPNDPQDAVVAGQYKKDFDAWKRTAVEWTKMYATPSTSAVAAVPKPEAKPLPQTVRTLLEMGFPLDKSTRAFEKFGNDLLQAIDYCSSN
jgi:ubiquitin-conjugating enzyme (huntingtin interacting protein 2)